MRQDFLVRPTRIMIVEEQTVHLARESGVAYLACGHHATERYGVQAIGQHCASQFGISHQFIDIPNPV